MKPYLPLPWVKSTHSSQDGGNCLEWAPASGTATGAIPVRDSKTPDGPTLTIPSAAFAEFIAGVKSGTFSA
ncbi:DUF397 domain-containing protein [Streptomyces chrestomyceticus]|uniref:DUF397 domain-containing protein n=1 Tax=Streptomyces chrestomyceticus TaxID=68185 RepID=UPI003687825C